MTTIEMARASHLDVYGLGKDRDKFVAVIERFAALVRADERNSWPAEMEAMERQVNILTDALAQAKADEREACSRMRAAKPRKLKPVGRGTLLDEQQFCFDKGWREGAASIRAAIRVRSNT